MRVTRLVSFTLMRRSNIVMQHIYQADEYKDDQTEINLQAASKQFRGKKFAELIMRYADMDIQQIRHTMQELMAELPAIYHDSAADFLKLAATVPPEQRQRIFGVDCHDRLVAIKKDAQEFFLETQQASLTNTEALIIANLVAQNYALRCHESLILKRAMYEISGRRSVLSVVAPMLLASLLAALGSHLYRNGALFSLYEIGVVIGKGIGLFFFSSFLGAIATLLFCRLFSKVRQWNTELHEHVSYWLLFLLVIASANI